MHGRPASGRPTGRGPTPPAWLLSVLCAALLGAVAVACQEAVQGTTQPLPPGARVGYYVTTNGSASGSGSASQPWNLSTAFSQPSAVRPGDTIWVRGGTYRGDFDSQLSGTAVAPIIVRQYPGERATIDGSVTVHGSYTWYWGFEVMNSSPVVGGASGVTEYADYIRLINLVIHDAGGNGVGFWSNGAGGDIYGCIIYNNGRNYNQDHGVYSQNITGRKTIIDNVIFNSMAYGVHIYGSSAVALSNYTLEGNTIFNNGAISPNALVAPNILIGGDPPAQGIIVRDNMTYLGSGSTGIYMGYSGANQDIVLTGNYFIGGSPALTFLSWSQATVTGNTVNGTGTMLNFQSSTSGATWGTNVWYRDPSATAWLNNGSSLTLTGWKQSTGLGTTDQAGSTTRPTGVKAVVRPNAYEPGRGFVTIYNWDQLSSVAVDVSSILASGARYEVRNVQNVFGAPVSSGTYTGDTLSFPMAAVPSPVPLGSGAITPPSTGMGFQVFLITPAP